MDLVQLLISQANIINAHLFDQNKKATEQCLRILKVAS